MLQIVLLAGKFVFLIILYLFIYRVIRSTTRELRSAAPVGSKQQVFTPAETLAVTGGPQVPGVASIRPGGAGVWTLVVQKSPSLSVGEAYGLPVGTQALAGRAPEMDIYLEDTFVSSKHALFETTTAGLQVEDLRSTNGTQVNGADISDARMLRPGDRVEVGDTVFQVEVR
jgi:hypothetical protein